MQIQKLFYTVIRLIFFFCYALIINVLYVDAVWMENVLVRTSRIWGQQSRIKRYNVLKILNIKKKHFNFK